MIWKNKTQYLMIMMASTLLKLEASTIRKTLQLKAVMPLEVKLFTSTLLDEDHLLEHKGTSQLPF